MLKKDELTIYLTSKCQLSCKHCYRPDGEKELMPDDLFWILDKIKNKRTTFLGGEPLLYPHIKDCIEAFPKTIISTNSLLVENNIDKIKGVEGIQLSVEGGRQETEFLRGKDVWETAISAAQLLEKEGIQFYLRTSFWLGNLGFLEEFNTLGYPLVLMPRLDKPPLPEGATKGLFEEVLRHDNWILALPNFMQYLGKRGRCKAGSERLNVLYDGKITPCNFDLDYTIGRIGDDINRVERNIDIYLDVHKQIPTECLGCKNVEVCRGSCYMVKAYAGCPLRYNFSISDFMGRYKIGDKEMKEHTARLTGFMRRMLVC